VAPIGAGKKSELEAARHAGKTIHREFGGLQGVVGCLLFESERWLLLAVGSKVFCCDSDDSKASAYENERDFTQVL
jgi:hypothetical protein